MRSTLLATLMTLIISTGWSQTRYKDLVFQEYTLQKNERYGEKRSQRFDLYQPANDPTANRPLIIWMHGGGFKFGSKKATGIRLWCKSFARRGYVCAAINYQL